MSHTHSLCSDVLCVCGRHHNACEKISFCFSDPEAQLVSVFFVSSFFVHFLLGFFHICVCVLARAGFVCGILIGERRQVAPPVAQSLVSAALCDGFVSTV